MSCPFRHLWPSGAAAPPGHGTSSSDKATAVPPLPAAAAAQAAAATPTPEQQQGGDRGPATPEASPAAAAGCPFLSRVNDVAVSDPSSSTAVATAGSAQAAAAGAAEPPAAAQGQPREQAAAVCPLGFGGGKQQPRLGEFHCPLCRSLYHNCVTAACGHRFCGGCIRGAADCPICGADVGALTPDEDTQAKVEQYIDSHAGSHTVWELEGAGSAGGGAQVDGMAGERSRASFLLQLGLRAIAAGNTDSARHRFQQCQADLLHQLEAVQQSGGGGGGPVEQAPLLCRLGAVSGCLGDCCRAEGDAEGTQGHYERSMELLQAAGEDPEAQQALSVALSKVGELHHLRGDLAAAAGLYARALELRRSLLAATRAQWHREGGDKEVQQQQQQETEAGSEGAEARCSAALDLAASCLKLSGARRGLGSEGDADALLAEALGLLEQQAEGLAQQPPRLQRKHAALAQFAAMMQQQQRVEGQQE